MTTETPEQRRTRLIDEYVLKNFHPYATCGNLPWLINIAKKVADAVIAATPQPEPEPKPVAAPHPSLQELGMQSTGLVDPPIKAGKLPPHPLLRLDGYPSEAETLLIELVERAVDEMRIGDLGFAANEINNVLAAIKKDLGVK